MADNSYGIEIAGASKNGYHTPAEARAYYGRYSREGITWHWWGDGTGASNHDNIVRYIQNKAVTATGSVNYVLSDNKISLLVGPDDVAWCSQAGNPTTISVELQPTLGAEGYKKAGWLMDQLEGRFGHRLSYYGHNHWFSTECPGTIDMNRIRAEADKWKSGAYDNPQPAPVPTPIPTPVPVLVITDIPNKTVRLKSDANLWDLNFKTYSEAKSIKVLPAGTPLEVSAEVNHPLGSTYYLTEYSYAKGIRNGINKKDTEDIVITPAPPDPTPVPTPTPIPTPIPVPVPDPTLDPEIKQNERIIKLEKFKDHILSYKE